MIDLFNNWFKATSINDEGRFKPISLKDLVFDREVDGLHDNELNDNETAKTPVVKPKRTFSTVLTVNFTNTTTPSSLNLEVLGIESEDKCVQPWNDFKKWFHAKASPTYTFHCQKRETTVLRSTICSYSIKWYSSHESKGVVK